MIKLEPVGTQQQQLYTRNYNMCTAMVEGFLDGLKNLRGLSLIISGK